MKPAFDLDNLRVATPCPKAWADMVGDDRVTLELSGTEVVGLLMANPSMIDMPPGSFTMSGDLLIRFPH
jgi:hypothetical protein